MAYPEDTIAVQKPHPYNRAVLAPGRPKSPRFPGGFSMSFSSKCWRVLRWAGLAAAAPALWACTSRTLEAPVITPTATVTTNFTQKINNEIDILFMIDNSSSMTPMQGKLYDQLPNFMNVLEGIPNKPNLHVAVVSSDMGAPSDTDIGCSTGDQGFFQSKPRSDSKLNPPVVCTDST